MPTYVYKFIETGETVEIQQSFADPTLTEYPHPETGEAMPVKKVFLPVGVTFKGDGFYRTDSRSASKASKASTSSGNGEAGSSGSTSSDSAGSSKESTSSTSSSDGSSTANSTHSSSTSASSSSSSSD